jgi:RNA recognition motif-containing protein
MGTRLFVGNLAFAVNDTDLRELFAQAGVCESTSIVMDRYTGKSRGFGFVEMASNEDAQKAIKQFHGHDLQGRALTVNEAKEREQHGNNGAGRGWSRSY